MDEEEMKPEIYHPPYYKRGDVECIDAIKASMTKDQWLGYLKGTVLKYLWRWDTKYTDPQQQIECLEKGLWFYRRLLEEAK